VRWIVECSPVALTADNVILALSFLERRTLRTAAAVFFDSVSLIVAGLPAFRLRLRLASLIDLCLRTAIEPDAVAEPSPSGVTLKVSAPVRERFALLAAALSAIVWWTGGGGGGVPCAIGSETEG
jgi:hypothetical protein